MSSTVRRAVLVLALVAFVFGVAPEQASSGALRTIQVPAGPDAMVAVGPNLWVASCSGNAVTEINRSTLQVVQTLTGSSYGFDCPYAIVTGEGFIWVANVLGGTLTQLSASSGAWIQTITGTDATELKSTFLNILGPVAMIVVGNGLWVANQPDFDNMNDQIGTFLSEFNVTTGATIRNLVPKLGPLQAQVPVSGPVSFAHIGTRIWIAGGAGISYEFASSNGKALRTLQPTIAPVDTVDYLTYRGGILWAGGDGGLSEYNAANGKHLRSVLSNYSNTGGVAFTGRDLFALFYSPLSAIREYNSDGKLIRTVARLPSHSYTGNDAILFDGAGLWFANNTSNTVTFYPVTS